MSFKQATSQLNLLSIKNHSCYKLSPAPPLIVSVDGILCLTTSVPILYMEMGTPCNPFLPHICSVFFTYRNNRATNCWKLKSSPTNWVPLFFSWYHLCPLSFCFGHCQQWVIVLNDVTQNSCSHLIIPNHCQQQCSLD